MTTRTPFYRDLSFWAAFAGGLVASAAYNHVVYEPEFLTMMTVAIIIAVPTGFAVQRAHRTLGAND